MNKKQKILLYRIIASAVLLLILTIINFPFLPKIILYAVAYFVIGYDILDKAVKGTTNGRIFDENFLMAVATLGAIILEIIEKNYVFREAVAVMLFYQIGEFFQKYAVNRSRKSIKKLMDIRPDYANVEMGGNYVQVSPDQIEIGQEIICNPGEKIPIDGVVLSGESSLNTSVLTGESIPKNVKTGDEVLSGCINLSGVLRIKTTREFGQSTASKILELVENSTARKAKSESFISKFARVYTPTVCFSALCVAVFPPLFLMFAHLPPQWGEWLYRALTFLVISCPCALVISIPLSFFVGIGTAGANGILIKGSNYIEALSKIKTVIFDKTGTLTKGVFEVQGIHHNPISSERLIEYAALSECASSHPISLSLQKAYGKPIDRSRVTDIEELSGYGVKAKVDGDLVAVGNSAFMDKLGIKYHNCHNVGTLIHVAVNGEYKGHIVITDVIKKNSYKAVKELKKYGITKTVMLTGDSDSVAKNVAKELNIDEYQSELLPAEKVKYVDKLLSEYSDDDRIAFAGDGVNDAPVLTRADVGIAMGALGSDSAIEAADVVLMDDDPLKISRAIKISRKCIRIVYQNIVFALSVKILCLVFGTLGWTNMWFAIFADVGVMVLCVLNALRIRLRRIKE